MSKATTKVERQARQIRAMRKALKALVAALEPMTEGTHWLTGYHVEAAHAALKLAALCRVGMRLAPKEECLHPKMRCDSCGETFSRQDGVQ